MYHQEKSTKRQNVLYGYPLPRALQRPSITNTHPLMDQQQQITEKYSVVQQQQQPSPENSCRIAQRGEPVLGQNPNKHLPCFMRYFQ